MAPGRQACLTPTEWEGRVRHTRRVGLLDQTDSVVLWAVASIPD